MLSARPRQRRLAPFVRSAVPLLVLAVTGLVAVPPAAEVAGESVTEIGGFNSVACPSSSQCLGVGITFATATSGAVGAAAPLTGDAAPGGASQPVQTIPGTELLSAVSCDSGRQCLAVGENPSASDGVAVRLDPATGALVAGQSVHSIAGISLAAVACPSTTRCLAVGHTPDGQGAAVSLNPASGAIAAGTAVQMVPGTGGEGLEGVACADPTECLAVGENAGSSAGVAVPLNPATGARTKGQSAQNVTTKGILVGVSCPSVTICLAVGWGADEPSVTVPLDPSTGMVPSGQRDQTISSSAAKLNAVSCPSVAQCLAVGNDNGDPSNGQAVALSPVTGDISSGQAIQSVTGSGALNGAFCVSATQCVVAGSGFEASGGAWLLLSAATGSPSSPLATTPPSTPSTGSAAPPPTTVIAAGSRPLPPAGGNLLPVLAGGIAFVAGGVALVGVTSRRHRKRTTTAGGE